MMFSTGLGHPTDHDQFVINWIFKIFHLSGAATQIYYEK